LLAADSSSQESGEGYGGHVQRRDDRKGKEEKKSRKRGKEEEYGRLWQHILAGVAEDGRSGKGNYNLIYCSKIGLHLYSGP